MSEFIQSLPDFELNRLQQQAREGGDYEFARNIIEREKIRRGLAAQALHTIDMPVADPVEYLVPIDPMDDLQCESCQ